MSIEFRCPKCNRMLRTPDGSAGKRVRCPACGNIDTIPSARRGESEPPSDIEPLLPVRDAEHSQSVEIPSEVPAPVGGPPAGHDPHALAFPDLLAGTMRICRANLLFVVSAMAVSWALFCLLVWFVGPIVDSAMRQSDAGLIGALLANAALTLIVSAFVAVFLVTVGLTASRRPADFFDARALLTAVSVAVIMGVAPTIIQIPLAAVLETNLPGVLRPIIRLVLLVVPIGIFATIAPAICLAVDQNNGISKNLSRSIELTRGHRVRLGSIFAGIWFLCGVPFSLVGLFLPWTVVALMVAGGLVWIFVLPLTAFALCAAYQAITEMIPKVTPDQTK